VNFEWVFGEDNFAEAQHSTVEDDIFGWIYIETENNKYIVDIHKEYYNSKDCGYDLEIYYENKKGNHGLWVGNINSIKSITTMCNPLKKFKTRAEKLLTEFITKEEKVAV